MEVVELFVHSFKLVFSTGTAHIDAAYALKEQMENAEQEYHVQLAAQTLESNRYEKAYQNVCYQLNHFNPNRITMITVV
jgi:hypothetical protein